MKYDEFAFFNQQLGAMVRDGIPLEGALQRLCADMQRGQLRTELELLAADLKAGTPLKTALAARKLPELYVQMVAIGAQSDNLPGVLLMLADHYRRVDSVWTRLKGLMVYPLLVLIAAFCVSCLFTFLGVKLFIHGIPEMDQLFAYRQGGSPVTIVFLLLPPIVIGFLLALWLAFLFVPGANRMFRWRFPAFKDAKLAQVASAMQMMLKTGGNLDDSLSLLQRLEKNSPAGLEISQWKNQLAQGRGKFAEMAVPGRAFPPLFIWLVVNAGEDLATGFQRAAEIYGARAVSRIEMFLYAALPVSILALGLMIICQILPVAITFFSFLKAMTSVDTM